MVLKVCNVIFSAHLLRGEVVHPNGVTIVRVLGLPHEVDELPQVRHAPAPRPNVSAQSSKQARGGVGSTSQNTAAP